MYLKHHTEDCRIAGQNMSVKIIKKKLYIIIIIIIISGSATQRWL
jgi:hypothetical protein